MRSGKTKSNVTLSCSLVNELDKLIAFGIFESRSAALEEAVRKLLRDRMDALIEAEVPKLNRAAEIAEAEEGMADFLA